VSTRIAQFGTDATEQERAARSIETPPESIAAWLLDGGAQSTTGPQRGGVAGWIDAEGRAEYIYPEITGYYMQWLAWLATCNGVSARLAQRAEIAQRWLAAWIEHTDPPETRVYLHRDGDDWRNRALFLFDLAMVLRGVASATRARLISPDEALLRRVEAQLLRLVASDGMFDSCRACPASASLPQRWSTRRGGFLAKAAAGVVSASEVLPISATLQQAAAATMTASLDAAIGQPHDETHPALYAIEGALGLPDRRAVARSLPALTNQVDMLLTHAAAHDGWLPEARAMAGVERLDIVAQAVRAAVLLRARCVDWSPDPRALEKMRHLLVRYITPAGALPFAPRAATPQYNAWVAMFAEQALRVSGPAVPHSRLYDLEAFLV
jgi:hypothetical protein